MHLEVHSDINALDKEGIWYEAKIVDERGGGDERELLVHYKGWKSRWDEWLGEGSGRVRAAGGKLGPCKRLASLAKVEAGSKVGVQHERGTWYDATVVDKSGTGVDRLLLVHYHGWNSRYDEWVAVCSGKMRASGGRQPGPSKPAAAAPAAAAPAAAPAAAAPAPRTAHAPAAAPAAAPPRSAAARTLR
eukprot:Transcript_8346.p1 GENE.Transcript_8346~~Transcript_8346.p1  ORF type:complete len:204 (+),score=36.25 Transcript_8346:46-612(+)